MNLSDDIKRLNHLHREIRQELFSEDRNDKRIWDFLERQAAMLLMRRDQVEGEFRVQQRQCLHIGKEPFRIAIVTVIRAKPSPVI